MSNTFRMQTKEYRLRDLSSATQFCDLCPRMNQRIKVFSEANGNVHSKVLFIAEAPGRLGADKTGIPLHGDKTGNNFESLLGSIGWKREDIFITNAVLCNPREENGNNGTPLQEEINNCLSYLEMAINLVQPEVIVTLGRVALEALGNIYPHTFSLNENVRELLDLYGKKLMPLYHPGPRAMVHRNRNKQTADFFELSKLVHPQRGLIIKKPSLLKAKKQSLLTPSWQPIHQMIYMIVNSLKKISYFKLTKLLFLIDLDALDKYGMTISGQTYLRQQEGPWMPQLIKYVKQMENNELYQYFKMRKPFIRLGTSPRINISLDNDKVDIIGNIIKLYGSMTDANIKTAVYRTGLMQEVLKLEHLGNKTKNMAIIHKNKTLLDTITVPT